MKDMLKSKSIIAFIVIMLGITFVASPSNKLESDNVHEEYVYSNIK
jgi:hypothetical protein